MNITKPRLDQFKITGSTVGDLHFPNVIFLAKFDGTNGSTSITDSSNKNHSITVNGGAQISTAASKFGGSSLKLDYENAGTGDRLVADTVADNLTSTTHTIEFWFKKTQLHVGSGLIDNMLFGSGTNQIRIPSTVIDGKMSAIYYRDGGVNSSFSIHSDNRKSIYEWSHVALVKERGSIVKNTLKVRAGVIDSGYTGEVFVNLVNLSNEDKIIREGDKLPVQIVVVKCDNHFTIIGEEEYVRLSDKSLRKEGKIGSSD